MICQKIQNKILALPDPRVLPESLREHVAGCPACRAWVKETARLETLLGQIPVPAPPGNKKGELVDELIREGPVVTLAFPARPRTAGSFASAFERHKKTLAMLAAAVLVVLGGWWLATRSSKGPEVAVAHPKNVFLEKMVTYNLALAKADDPLDRVQILGGMAETVSGEAHTLARVANGRDLQDLSDWFDKLVKDGVLKQARDLPVLTAAQRAERKSRFGALAERLAKVAADAEKLSGAVPEDSKPAIRKIADSARDAEKQLQSLLS